MGELGITRRKFAKMVGEFLNWLTGWCSRHGLEWAPDRLKCCPDCSKDTSLHRVGLALDIVLYEDGKPVQDTQEYLEPGLYWESLGGAWGGRFGDDPNTTKIEGWDGGHFSLSWHGRR